MLISRKIIKENNVVYENIHRRIFDLWENQLQDMKSVHFVDSTISHFKGRVNCPEVSFLSSTVNCNLMNHFSEVKKLSVENSDVDISNISNVTDVFLSELNLEFSEKTFREVINLTLKKCNIRNFEEIGKLEKLKMLNLSYNNFRDDNLKISKIVFELEKKGVDVTVRV